MRWFAFVALAGLAPTAPAQSFSLDLETQSKVQAAASQFRRDSAAGRMLARRTGWPLDRVMPDGSWMRIVGVQMGMPLYHVSENREAAATINVTPAWPGGASGLGLTGSGVTLGIWDGGDVSNGTGEFTGRVVDGDGTLGNSSHATHVAGTMLAAGVDPRARGMSYEANLRSYDSSSDEAEMIAAAANGLLVSNHSYGILAGWRLNGRGDGRYVWSGDPRVSEIEDWKFGFYHSYVAENDQIAFDAPYYLMVRSGGNHRNDGPSNQPVEHWIYNPVSRAWELSSLVRDSENGYDTLAGWSVGKNVLTVGAVNDLPNGWQGPSSVQMSSFSSWGPTDDGRIKPDVVANGVGLYSPSGNGYSIFSGTSMAAPNASGALGLLIQQQRLVHGSDMRAATLKAYVLNTTDEAGAAPGPDYAFGWGLVNATRAAQLILASGSNPTIVHEEVLSEGGNWALRFASDGTEPIRATLSWTDPAGPTPTFGSYPPYLDPPNRMLVNDLQLRIEGPGGEVLPWILDPANPAQAATTGNNDRDNVEQILIDAPAPGVYTLRVSHAGALQGGSQAFSVVLSGGGPAPAELAGSVTLADYLPGPVGVELLAEIVDGDAVVETHPAVLGTAGAFAILTDLRGDYDLRMGGGTWLKKRIAVAIGDDGIQGIALTLTNGDVDGSNRVDLDDYFELADAYRTAPGDANWNPRADLDGSGFVDLDDYFVLADAYRLSGD